MHTPSTHYASAYRQVDVETASQGKLIVMLFNGAIQRAEQAQRQMQKNRFEGVHNNLIRAQEIIGELRGALNMSMGDIPKNLDRIYEYFQYLLIQANIRKETAPIAECVRLMSTMRDTWQEAFEAIARETFSTPAPSSQHAAPRINITG
ncbi:MAG TPA: flagellar export chaperone FliS [Candidatus Hydrogenedentes bacterium]|nr:flagellar export chaperone FliS [Candidatus Hydrogenedentota bacterium]